MQLLSPNETHLNYCLSGSIPVSDGRRPLSSWWLFKGLSSVSSCHTEAFSRNFFESPSVIVERGMHSGKFLPSSDRRIDIDRIEFDYSPQSLRLLTCDQRGSRSSENVKND